MIFTVVDCLFRRFSQNMELIFLIEAFLSLSLFIPKYSISDFFLKKRNKKPFHPSKLALSLLFFRFSLVR